MRIRRKKRLDERITNCSEVIAVADRDVINVNVAVKNKKYFDTEKLFGNNNGIEMDIGCGKGSFVCELARRNPEKNYFAVDMIENIIIVGAERAQNEGLKNLRFINTGAEYLPRYIKDGSIDKIYLNFSPPYPKSSYSNRRLTNDRFIAVFKRLLKPEGQIEQKTDDKVFFDYSVRQLEKHGFTVEDLTSAYVNGEISDNVRTEFECRFNSANVPVYMLRAKMKKRC